MLVSANMYNIVLTGPAKGNMVYNLINSIHKILKVSRARFKNTGAGIAYVFR